MILRNYVIFVYCLFGSHLLHEQKQIEAIAINCNGRTLNFGMNIYFE